MSAPTLPAEPDPRPEAGSAAVEPLGALSDGQVDRVTTVAITSRRRGWIEVTAERTECEHLFITPVLSNEHPGLAGLWHLTHEPTGQAFGDTDGLDVRELRDVARLVADLDWSSPDPAHYAEPGQPYVPRLREAVDRATGMPGRTP